MKTSSDEGEPTRQGEVAGGRLEPGSMHPTRPPVGHSARRTTLLSLLDTLNTTILINRVLNPNFEATVKHYKSEQFDDKLCLGFNS